MANPMLLWFVGYSNLTSIFIVTFCFLAMTIFIGFISMNVDYPGRSNIQIGIEQRNMVKMSNPFFLQLEHHGRKLEDGLHLCLSSLLPSKIFVIWGAKIHPFHDFILKPGRLIRKAFVSNKVEDYRELDILHCDKLQFSEAGEHSINLHCPDSVSSESLGDMPRKRYPVTLLVFVMENPSSSSVNASSQSEPSTISDEDLSESESDSNSIHSIIGLISIIHLRDDKVTQNSHIISQFVKTSGVPLYSLQPLYLSSDSCESQQNRQNIANVAKQDQNKNKTDNSEILPEKLQASSNVNTEGCSAVASTSSVCEPSEKCLSCGGSLVVKSDSSLRKRDSHSSKFERTIAGVCDSCHTNRKAQADEKHDNRPVKEQRRGSGNEGKVTSDLSCDTTDVDNNKDTLDCHASDQAECVVCQTHQVRCALLPCRHACVCLGCFKLLYRCPMCRAGIESYFLLRHNLNAVDGNTDDEDDHQNESGENEMLQNLQHQAVNASIYQIWQRFNTRLNNILGFR